MRKSKFKQTMSMLLAVLMVFMSMNFSVFAEELTAPTDETTTTTVEAPAEQPAEEQTPAVEAPAPADEETGTTEENTTDNSLQQERSALLQAPVTNGEAIAKIDDQDYTDQSAFLTAFNALAGVHTVQLFADVDLGIITTNNAQGHAQANDIFLVRQDAQIILDLNGWAITGDLASGNNYNDEEIIGNFGVLTIQDSSADKTGKIENTAANPNICVPTVSNEFNATLIVEGGTIQSTKGNAITNYGKATIYSGTIRTNSPATGGWDNGAAAIHNRGNLVIEKKDGLSEPEISTNRGYPVWCGDSRGIGNAQISAGKFTTNHDMDIKIQTGHFDTVVNVTGGTWDKDPTDYVSKPYIVKKDSSGIYTVVKGDDGTKEAATYTELKRILSDTTDNWVEILITDDITVTDDLTIPLKANVEIQPGKTLKISNGKKVELSGKLINNGILDISTIDSGWINNIDQFKNNGQIIGLPTPENNVYKISTVNQLQFLQYVMVAGNGPFTGTIEIQNPIDAQGYKFRALGDNTNVFSGTFDGKENEIKNITVDAFNNSGLLFNRVTDATFQNLNLTNCDIYTNGGYLGLLAGSASGTTIVKDSTLGGKLSADNTFFGGGLFGSITPGGLFNFENCVMDLDITAPYNVGTFWGSTENSSVEVTIVNCSNAGDINATGGSYGTIGGWGHGLPLKVTVFGYDYTGTVTENGKVQENPKYCTKSDNDQFIVAAARIQNSDGSTQYYGSIQEAVSNAANGDTIEIAPGTYNLESTLKVEKPLTLRGMGGVVIMRDDTWSPAQATSGEQGSLINIDRVTGPVVLENLTVQDARNIDGASGHGINIVQSADVTVKNITSKGNAAAGVVVNGSTVTASDLYTSGNGWYGVNVDQGSGVTDDTLFTLKAPYRFGETYQIVSDKYNSSDNIEVNLPEAFVQSDLENKSVYWNDSSTMIKNQNKNRTYPTIQAAIEDANRNNTILIPAGTYAEDLNITQSVILKKVEKAESDCVLDGNITVAEGKKVTLSDLNAGTNAAVMVKKGANLALINSDAFVENQHITVEKLFGTEYDTSIIKQNDQEVAKDKLSFVYLGEEIKPDMNLFRANEVSYTIKTPAQFYWLSQQINGGSIDTSKVTIKLGNDLDFHNDEWLPVGVKGHDYVGSFDGQNYKISNLYVNKPGENYTGLFGKAWGAKELENVDFENVNITGEQYAGTLAGQLGSSTVKNVNVNNFVFRTGKFTGGIVGSGYSNISNCKVQSGSIATEDQNVGGILGFLGEGNFTIQNCHSDQITISEPSWDAGGLIGATVYGNVKVYNCSVNNSTITITASGWFEGYGSYRGELIGEMRGSKTYEANLYLYNCNSENTTAINKNVAGDQSQLVGGNQDYIKKLTVYNENNKTPYATIQEAIDTANSGDTIKIGTGTYDEAITLTKAVNLIGPYADTEIKADEATMDNRPDESEAILTGGITINRTDTAENPSITISGLKFKTNGIQATGWGNNPKLENVTITDNVFDALRPSGNVAAIHFNLDAGTPAKNLTIDNNRITNVGGPVAVTPNPSGINTDVVEGKTNITNNYIDGTNHSSLQISGTAKGEVTITGNTFKNWDQNYEYDQLEKDGGGRAMRFGDFSGASLTVSQNKMVRAFEEQGLDKDQMVKFTKVPESGEFDLSLNYWNGKLPVTTYGKAKDSSVIVVSEGTAKINAVPYFTDEAMTNAVTPVQIEGSDAGYLNIQEAVNAAKADDTIILNADEYLLEAPVQIDKALTIKAGTNAVPWVKAAQNQNAFTVTGDVTGSLSFDGVNITAQTAPTGNESPKGIDVQQKAISGSLIYKNAEIKDMYYGILVSVNSSEAKAKIVNTLDINHAVFTDNLHKAVYVENANTVKVDSTTFTGDASTGTEYWPTRIALDINEKYNSYDSVSVTNCAFNNIQGTPGTPSQEGQVGYGAALAVKARNDGSYADPAASLKNVTITGNIFIGNTCDLMIGEPAAEGKVAEHTWNLGTVNIQKNAFSSKVQNNYKQKTDTSQNYWRSETPNFTALTAGLMEVYPYYTDAEMTKLYAPIELRSADGKEVKYFGTVKDAFTVANDSDTVVINQTSDGQPATVDEPIDMNVVSGSKLITVNLQLEGSTTFNKAFTGTTKGHMILSTGKNADQPTIAIFNGSVDGFVSVDAVNFDSAKAPVIKALSSETDPNSFISKTGVLSVSEEGDYRIWTYGSPSENFNGGDGSEAKPYQINTVDQLKLLAKDGFNTKKYFKLTNDIAVNDWTALAKFEGNFDGNGYSITGNSVNFIDALVAGAKVEKLRFEGFTNLVNTNNGTVENCFTVGEKPTAIVNIMESGGALTDSFTAGTKAVQTNEAQGTVLHVYHCGETGGIGTAMTKADMQKARFANMLNSGTEGVWDYNADVEAPSAYPFVMVDDKTTTIQKLGKVNVSCDASIGKVSIVQPDDGIYAKDTITLKAEITNSDYDFLSWTNASGEIIGTNRTCDYTVRTKDDVGTFTANFTRKPTITVSALNFNASAGSISVNGIENSNAVNAEINVGTMARLKATPKVGYKFVKWTTLQDMNTAVSVEDTFTIYAGTSNLQYLAHFEEIQADKVTVSFKNSVTGAIIGQPQTIDKNGEVAVPEAPVYLDRDFVGWYDGNIKASVVNGKIQNVQKDTTYEARYTQKHIQYTVTVTNGSIDGEQGTSVQKDANSRVTVIANTPEQGKQFAGWKYTNGDSIISYDATYTFTLKADTSIEATYSELPVEKQPTVSIDPNPVQIDQSEGLYKLRFIVRSEVPDDDGYTPIKCGIVAKKADVANPEELALGAADVIVGGKTNIGNQYTYTVNLGNLAVSTTVSARGYLTYMKNGETYTIYTDMVKGTVVAN